MLARKMAVVYNARISLWNQILYNIAQCVYSLQLWKVSVPHHQLIEDQSES